MKPIKLVLTENESLTLLGLSSIIEKQSDMEIVASVTTGKNAIKAIRNGADVALIDSNLPDMNDLGIVNIVRQMGCQTVVSSKDTSDILTTAMQHNVNCLYLKTSNPNLLPQAIRSAFNNQPWIDPGFSRDLIQTWGCNFNISNRRYNKGRSHYDRLTKTEIEILKLIASGCSYEEMANKTYITVATIRCHVNSIYSKLAVNNKVKAIIKGIELKYLNVIDLKNTDIEEKFTNQLAAI